jgi:hypothetical protein
MPRLRIKTRGKLIPDTPKAPIYIKGSNRPPKAAEILVRILPIPAPAK